MTEPTTCTVSVGSADDPPPDAPALTITTTGADLAHLDSGLTFASGARMHASADARAIRGTSLDYIYSVDASTRPRRSRQNRSRRARGARRLAIRTGKAHDPRQQPPVTLTLRGHR